MSFSILSENGICFSSLFISIFSKVIDEHIFILFLRCWLSIQDLVHTSQGMYLPLSYTTSTKFLFLKKIERTNKDKNRESIEGYMWERGNCNLKWDDH